MSHLSSITKKDFSPTNPRLKRIQTLCKDGYGIKDFKAVNLYFSMKWTSPDMKNYVRPETLYNTKFVSRLVSSFKLLFIVALNFNVSPIFTGGVAAGLLQFKFISNSLVPNGNTLE